MGSVAAPWAAIVLKRGLLVWGLLHLTAITMAFLADDPDPIHMTANGHVLLAALTAAVTGFDLRRRHYHRLLPLLGVSFPLLLLGLALAGLGLEVVLALLLSGIAI